jgi:hypothetical protein
MRFPDGWNPVDGGGVDIELPPVSRCAVAVA